MGNIVDLEILFHRSKERIKDLGEVFTPEYYVEGMLNLLSIDKQGIWSDEEVLFFEPCAGHGNIAVSIYKRRLEGIYKKVLAQDLSVKTKEAPFYAVANALNTLWAIDIDPKNVESCQSRIFSTTLNFLKIKLEINNDITLVSKRREFFAHILSAIKWQIFENETLSSLSDSENAKTSANITKSGAKWFLLNGHKEIGFELTWVKFFASCKKNNTIPIEYERSLKFVDAIISQRFNGFNDYKFAKDIVSNKQSPIFIEKTKLLEA